LKKKDSNNLDESKKAERTLPVYDFGMGYCGSVA